MGTVRPVCMPQWEFIVCWLVSSVSWGVSPLSSEDCGVGYLRIGVDVQKKNSDMVDIPGAGRGELSTG